jgi:hypothetical protein
VAAVLAEPAAAQVVQAPVLARVPVAALEPEQARAAAVRVAPAAAVASRMSSVADKALPALRACAMKPLHDPTVQRGAKA